MRAFSTFKAATAIIILLIGVSVFILIANKNLFNLSPEDSSAIVGGKPESGYPYAGYMLGDLGNNRLNVCGNAYITKDIIVTAAHCVYGTKNIVAGINDFDANSYKTIKAEETLAHPLWSDIATSGAERSTNDIAMVKLEKPQNDLSTFVQIVSPKIGCNYEVIGYGQTGDTSASGLNRQRKSATLCIEEIYDKVMLARGQDGGLCFGDSGSPVFETDTNRMIGVMSAAQMDENGRCNVSNLALVVRLEEYQSFVSEFVVKNTTNNSQPSLALCGGMDSDSNGKINIADFDNFAKKYLTTCSVSSEFYTCGSIDSNRDGVISSVDLASFVNKFGRNSCL